MGFIGYAAGLVGGRDLAGGWFAEDRGSIKEWRWQDWWAEVVKLNRRGSIKGWLDWLAVVLGKSLALRIRIDRFQVTRDA